MEEKQKRYVGVYNYTKNGRPMIRVVGFSYSEEIVRHEIEEHIASRDIHSSPSDYHISTYECKRWDDQNGEDLPMKVDQKTFVKL